MNEFNFRVANAAPRASGFEIGKNVGDIQTTYIYSYKTKYINGKSTGQKTNVDWDMESSIPGWVSVKYAFEGNDCKVTFTTLEENTGSSVRTHTLVMKQRESGETISFPISQEPNFTYTYFLDVLNPRVTIGSNIGSTATIVVQSYMTRSDGEIMAKPPSVGATPSWASKVIVKDYSATIGANWYHIIVEVTATNPSSSERSGTLLVTCGDQRKEVTILQKAVKDSISITINWPSNTKKVALFAAGNQPSPNGQTSYFLMSVMEDITKINYQRDIGIPTNLSNGSIKYALPGDRVYPYKYTSPGDRVYPKFDNGRWSSITSFVLPSSDTIIKLYNSKDMEKEKCSIIP